MRKYLVFLILTPALLSLCAYSVKAQGIDNLKRVELEAHVGPAFPIGSFSRPAFSEYTPFEDDNKGTLSFNGAKIGVNYGLSLGYYVSPNWGIMILFNGHSNNINPGDNTVFSPVHPEYEEWEIKDKDNWSEFMALAGISYRALIVSRLVFSARAFLGYAHLRSPFYSASAMHGNAKHSFQLNSARAHSFGYGADVALKFLVTRGFHLDLRCGYLSALPFKYNKDYKEKNGTVTEEYIGMPDDITQKSCAYSFKEFFQTVNLSFGITIGL